MTTQPKENRRTTMQHQLAGDTLKRENEGIVARCKCGWTSVHFTSLAASAAFMDHQEKEHEKEWSK